MYDPASPEYHKFLSVEEFTAQFGPTEEDYQEVVDFAVANGLTVTTQTKNRLVVPVEGSVAQVNRAFNVRLGEYQHPTEARTFYSPDREPAVALHAQIAHIDGMNNFYLPQAMNNIPLTNQPMASVNGSGPGGSYLGSDMRAAYYGGTTLTGLNQTVALVEFGGYLKSDVDLNFSNAGQTYSVPVQNILVGTATNAIYQQDEEQVLDIVQAIGMAPGLAAVNVYIGDPTSAASAVAVLNQIVTDNSAKQIGCSWGWIPGDIPSQEGILQEMAAQGQTFFAASGDSGAYQASINPYFYPAESQYVTAVGGTHLTTAAAGGAWSSEVAWNSNGAGSGGGISPDRIPIPSWQSGLATSSNGGSNALRNVPDVAMEADFDNYVCNLGSCSTSGAGTSFAAPRWAGFMALVNQQAVEAGNASLGGVGFINTALSQIGTGTNYTTDFHDIQSGNNNTRNQIVWFSAVPGYDLVTGWGSPTGQSLIDDLAGKMVPGFWISSSIGTVSVVQGASATATISVTPAGGFSGNVNLAVTSTLPSGVTASFAPTSTSTTSVLTLTASNSAAQGTYPVTITGTSGTITETTTINVAVHGPSFTLSSSRSSLTVNQGASATSTITVNDLYGFTGSVNLQVTGLPSGLTASFGTNPTSTTSVLTLQASGTALSWSGYITVTGTSGSLTASTRIYVSLVAPTFTISVPGTISMGQGTTTSSYVNVTPQYGFTGNVTLSISGLPNGVTAFFTPNPISSTGELTITVSSTATVGSATLTITGTSGAITATTTITLKVNAPAFTLSGVGSVSLGVGSSATTYINVNDQWGFTGSVTLTASGLPAGVTASFSPNATTYSSQMILSASSSAVPGTYTITVAGTAGSITSSTTIALTVGTPTFTISAPSSETLSQSGSLTAYVYANSQYGFNGSVTVSVSGLPSGVTASLGTNPTTYSTSMVLTASASVPTGSYTVTITGTSGSITKATTMTLSIVAPSFQISSSSSITLGIGTTNSVYVYVYGNNGYNGSVTLSVSGLPSGITASFSQNPVSLSGSNSSQLTFTAAGTVGAGSYTVTLTGTSGAVTASTSITITVAAPSFTLSGGGSLTIGQGSSGSTYIYANGVNGFSGNVTLSVSGLPSGVTAAFGTNPTTYYSSITFSATNSAPTGTYPITVTGTSGAITASMSVQLTIAAPSFTLSTGSSYALNQGASTTGYLYLNSTNGFSGAVTLSASGLPSGVTLTFGANPTSNYSTLMTIAASGSATPGTSTVTITGTYGSTTTTTTFTLTVNAPSFALMAAPGSMTLTEGGTESSTVAVAGSYGFTGSVSFSISGLPSGVTASWNPASSTTGSVLTLTAGSSAPTGTTTATITGTSGTLVASAQLPVTIRSAAISSTTALAMTSGGSSVTTTTWGTPVTLTASVTAGGSPVTAGLVNFCDSTASYCGDIHLLGTAQLNSSGAASIKLLPLPGAHSYKAVFAGTAAYSASSSASAALQVTGTYPTRTAVASSGTVGNYTLNATVNGAGMQAPTGNISFVDTSNANASIATARLVAGTPALTWSQLSTTPTGPYPGAIVTGDFNGDGITDAAVIVSNYNALTILLGNADGTLTISNLSPQTSASPAAITAADFNNDGNLDLAVVTSTGVVNIFLGNGDGTFNAANASITTGASAGGIVAGDFNGDGIADLAISDALNNRLVILLGKGDGTFTAVSSHPATGSYPRAMAVADFNGDGWPDIAVVNANNNTVSLLLGNGDGTFSPMPSTLQAGSTPSSLAVADFNGDGKPDLAVASTYSTTLSIFLGKGDGTFTSATSPSVVNYDNALIPMDVNQDGVVDLFVGSQYNSAASVLLGKGDGTFTQGASVTLPATLSSAAAGRVGSGGFPAVIATFSSLNEAVAFEPYVAQSASASATGISMGATGSHKVAASYAGDSTYAGSQSTTVTINGTKNDSIIAWATPVSIVYGTALDATQLNATANVPGTFVYSPAAGAVLGAGTQTLSVTFTPNDTTNYTTVTATVQLVVNKAPLTVTANNASMAYGAALPTLSGTLTGVISGDGITASYATTATSSSAVGSYPITATLNDPNSKLGNYAVTNTPATLTIGQATPAITWSSPSAITYGIALSAAQLNASSTVAGTLTYTPALGTMLPAGTQNLSVTLTPNDSTDYTPVTQTVQLLVNKAPLTVTANNASMTYGGALPTPSGTLTGVISGDGITASYATTATSSSTAGPYPITATLNDPNGKLGNYAVTNTPGTLTIGKATSAITWATPAAITYGTALNATQLNATSPVAGTFSYSPAAGTVLSAGAHTMTANFTPADATDYTSATASVAVTVTQATPGIALSSSANPVFFSNPVTITAMLSAPGGASSAAAAPGGSVAFYDGTTQLGTAAISAGSAVYTTSTLTAGTHAITAVYAGDSNYVTATSGALSQVVENFTVAPSGSGSTSATISPGGQAIYTLVFSPPNGATFPAAINLAVTGLPTGATAVFSPAVIPAGAGPTTVTLTVNVPATSAKQVPQQPFGQSPWPIALGLIFLPCAVMRRKHLQKLSKTAWLLLLAIAAVASTASLIGCGGHSSPPQTYTLTVTATSGSLSNSTTLTLTVQ